MHEWSKWSKWLHSGCSFLEAGLNPLLTKLEDVIQVIKVLNISAGLHYDFPVWPDTQPLFGSTYWFSPTPTLATSHFHNLSLPTQVFWYQSPDSPLGNNVSPTLCPGTSHKLTLVSYHVRGKRACDSGLTTVTNSIDLAIQWLVLKWAHGSSWSNGSLWGGTLGEEETGCGDQVAELVEESLEAGGGCQWLCHPEPAWEGLEKFMTESQNSGWQQYYWSTWI